MMQTIILGFGCYVYLILILNGIALICESETLFDLIEFLWRFFPIFCVLTFVTVILN